MCGGGSKGPVGPSQAELDAAERQRVEADVAQREDRRRKSWRKARRHPRCAKRTGAASR